MIIPALRRHYHHHLRTTTPASLLLFAITYHDPYSPASPRMAKLMSFSAPVRDKFKQLEYIIDEVIRLG